MHILLIEPDVILADVYADALRREGNTVQRAATAQQAIQAADSQLPDAVVLNIDLAAHNGIEFLYEFKSYPEWSKVPVVLLVSQINHDLSDSAVLREQLSVERILSKSQTTTAKLCEAVQEVGQLQA